jgi:hypothetical protein
MNVNKGVLRLWLPCFHRFSSTLYPLSTKSRICCENPQSFAGGISEKFTFEAFLVWKTHMDR